MWKPNLVEPSAKVVLSTRVPQELHASLGQLAKFWTDLDKELSDRGLLPGVAHETNLSEVVVRLLEVGLATAWTEIGGRPASEKEHAALIKRAVSSYTKR